MLRHNFVTQYGLANGCTGTIVDIIYKQGEQPPALPDVHGTLS